MSRKDQDREAEVVVTSVRHSERFDLREASEFTGLRVERIVELTRAELVPARPGKVNDDDFFFDERGLTRLRRIAELHESEGLGLEILRTLTGLMDRLERAEAELRFLRK